MIYKATFTITVLVEAENAGEAWQSFLQDPHTILEEMDSGVMIGSCTAPEESKFGKVHRGDAGPWQSRKLLRLGMR